MLYRPTLTGFTDKVLIFKFNENKLKKNSKILVDGGYSVVIYQNKKYIGTADNLDFIDRETKQFVLGQKLSKNKKPYGYGLENLKYSGLFTKTAKNLEIYFVLPSTEYINSKKYAAHDVDLCVAGDVTNYDKFISFYLSLGFKPAKYGAVLTSGSFIVGLRNLAMNDHQLYNDMLRLNNASIKERLNNLLSSQMGFVFTHAYSDKHL